MNDPARQLAALAQAGGITPLPTDYIGPDETLALLVKAGEMVTLFDKDLGQLTAAFTADAAIAQAEALDDDDVFMIGNDQAALIVLAAVTEALRRSIVDAAYAARTVTVSSPESARPEPPTNFN
jgi:hypothetical protein